LPARDARDLEQSDEQSRPMCSTWAVDQRPGPIHLRRGRIARPILIVARNGGSGASGLRSSVRQPSGGTRPYAPVAARSASSPARFAVR
jgi:hypothetical protein